MNDEKMPYKRSIDIFHLFSIFMHVIMINILLSGFIISFVYSFIVRLNTIFVTVAQASQIRLLVATDLSTLNTPKIKKKSSYTRDVSSVYKQLCCLMSKSKHFSTYRSEIRAAALHVRIKITIDEGHFSRFNRADLFGKDHETWRNGKVSTSM